MVNIWSSPVGQVHGGVRDPPRVPAAALVDKAHVGEQVGLEVLGGDLAPRQHVKTLGVHVLEQGRGPAAAVEPNQDPSLVTNSPT